MHKLISFLQSPAFRAAFMALAVLAALWAVVSNWGEVKVALRQLTFLSLAGTLALSFAFVVLTMLAWRILLNQSGPRVSNAPARRLFYASQVAKYLPGGVWNFVAAAEMGTTHNISRRRSVTVLLTSMLISVVTGLIIGSFAVLFGPGRLYEEYWWILLVLPVLGIVLVPPLFNRIVNAALALLKRERLEAPISGRAIFTAAAISVVAWVVAGAQVWIILVELGNPVTWSTFFLTLGGYAMAWVVGFLVFFVPAGVGIREVALGVALGTHAQGGDIVVTVLLSRILFTLADLVLGVLAGIMMRKDSQVS